MKGKIWDWYAPIYKRAMRAEERSYAFLYRRIPKLIRGKEVLELATGPGCSRSALRRSPSACSRPIIRRA